MKLLKVVALAYLTGLLGGCASSGGSQIPEKGTASIALQITNSIGKNIFKDHKAPKGQIEYNGLLDHSTSMLIGIPLSTMFYNLGLSILSNNKHGWEHTNYIMYLDADKYKNFNKEEICPVVLNNMETTMPQTKDYLQPFTSITIDENIKFNKTRYNGGGEVCTKGFPISEPTDSKGWIGFRTDDKFIGSWVNVQFITKPFSIALFDDELRKQIPYKNVIAVRFNYLASTVIAERVKGNDRVGTNGISSSPFIKLPTATFISLPEKERVHKNRFIKNISGVRNNEFLYYFVKPKNGKQFAIPLNIYHNDISKKILEISL